MSTATEMLNLLKTRRSVRAYKPDAVPEALLDQVLEAGTYAPSAKGLQSPTLIAVTTPEYRERIARLNAAVMGSDKDPYYGAPENMMLAAHALGLSTVWVHREREIFDSEAGKALLREWGLPETLRGVGSIALGYGAVPASQPKPRKEGYIVKV